MRIRGSSINSSLSSNSTSGQFTQSTLSFASCSSNSLNSSVCSSFSIRYDTRYDGLDLLVKAVLHLSGSVLCVPFTQKRVIRRRKRAFRFPTFMAEEFEQSGGERIVKDEGITSISKSKRRRRGMAVPSKFQDSVMQPWKRRSRRQKQSGDLDYGSD
ncbi:hypothetical protein Scep_009909 [Stephania cephalantha]|uniref:Uncharacterized protein n=1 Tax=Stephania cephalantha TaxID=152367 RepID=A0AAP0PCW6_9MAGN